MRSLLRHLPVVMLAAATFLLAGRASAAPTVAFTSTPPIRLASDGKTQIPTLIVHGNQQGVNFKECADDTYIQFSLQLGNLPTSDSLQAWAGTGDCTQAGTTSGQNPTCWPIFPSNIQATSLVLTVNVRVADIVSQLFSATKVLTYSAAKAPDVCSSAAANTTTTTTTDDAGNTVVSSGETSVNIWFMWFGGGKPTPDSNAPAYPIKVKLVGPNAPTNVAASSGDGEVIVTWNGPPGEADLQGYNVYASPSGGAPVGDAAGDVTTVCGDAAQGTQLLDDAGLPVYDDAGNPVFVDDAGNPITQDAGCYQVYNPPGGGGTCSTSTSINTSDQAIDAGTTIVKQATGTTNAKASVTGLTNGVSYAIAVAAFDSFQNDGQLSSVVCASPAAIDDFWKKYREEGGTAGGFCALQAVGGPGGMPFGALVMIVAGAAIARYRRRRSGRDNDKH
ncbi:MAG TPA: hypothetical protein VLM85_03565 [Polyangiaceae bacterium]|nr:hypothetical protein [Polyangiaceae bacterium]